MSSNTKVYEDKMKSSVEHLGRELGAVRAGRANPAVLDKVSVDYYGAPTPIQQVASVAVAEARTLTITPWDRTLLRPISKAIMASDVGITPIDDGSTIRLNFPAPTEERRKQLAKEVSKLGEEAKVAVRNIRREAMDKAKVSGLPEDAQAARDLADQCERFEKKLYDLELTRNISLQMGPQIRLLQNNNTMMAEKIQSTIVNTIPLWKNQMVLALGLAHTQKAMQAERAVTDMTNDLLKKNADALKMGTIETAKESQRGVVDIETLQQTNKSLIETLDELNKIQTEGRAKRVAAEQELTRIEDELKQKMMEIRS